MSSSHQHQQRWYLDWLAGVIRTVDQCIAWKAETILLVAVEPEGYPNGTLDGKA
jgi:hypothetical protein